MSQQTQHSQAARLRTLHGGYEPEAPPIGGEPGESRFVPIGARVGRSGQVFETDGGTGRGSFVVKLFTWGADLPEEVVRGFTREVTTVAILRHPHVVQVVDAGTLGDGTPFVVMERLAGTTLEEAVRGRRLQTTDVLPIVFGVGSALSAAHAAGIAHGEVRADNVFMAEGARSGRACPKLLDFGVAQLAARSGRELGGRAAERADQLALATLARRLLGEMKTAAIERVLERAMSPDPSQRFGTVAAFVAAFEDALVGATRMSTRHAVGTTMLVGAAVPISPGRPVVAASPPSSLTQQFFAEGDQLEISHAARQTGGRADIGPDDQEDDAELEDVAAAGVPRSRAQMILAALLALGSVAVIGWTVVSLASKPGNGSQVAERPAIVAGAAASSTPPAHFPARAIERGPQKVASAGNRALRGRPRPAAAAERPTVTGVAPPSSSGGPALAPPAAPTPAPVVAPIAAPIPAPVAAPIPAPVAAPSEGAAQARDRTTPDVAPAATGDDVAAQPDDHEQSEQGDSNEPSAPTPGVPDETAPAP